MILKLFNLITSLILLNLYFKNKSIFKFNIEEIIKRKKVSIVKMIYFNQK